MKSSKPQIQISDLLTEAVANATERRELAMGELSTEAAQNISGGSVSPIILGKIVRPPIITVGIIATPIGGLLA